MLGPVDTGGASIKDAFNAPNRFVQLKVDNNSPITPRQQILSVPYALKAGSVVDGAIGAAQIADSAVTARTLQNWAVTASAIADGSVLTTKFADGSVTGAKIADETISGQQIANMAISSTELADDAVLTTTIRDGDVTTAKIADGQVTLAKFLPRSPLTSAPLGGLALSKATGLWVMATRDSWISVTLLTLTLETSGRPVLLVPIPETVGSDLLTSKAGMVGLARSPTGLVQPKNRSWFWAVRGQAARSAAPLWLPGGDN